jgi:membrane fusion protein (multidrug efflux system)
MQDAFSRTTRALAHDAAFGARFSLAVAVVLAIAWGAWFSSTKVPIYESSSKARVEVLRATHPVDTPSAGRVVEVDFALDGTVREGDVLLRLDSSTEELQLQETRAKIAATGPQLEALRNEATAQRQAMDAYRGQLYAQLAEAQSHVNEAAIMSEAGRIEAKRSEQLYDESLVSDAERQRAKAESERRAAAEKTARSGLERLRRESATGTEDRNTRIVSLESEVASLSAQLATLQASIPILEHAVDLRTVRAPASGRIGETANVRVGQVLAQGAHIATVLAPGDLRMVALFEPSAAMGRVRAGQTARVRLDAFPWTEYGALRATVSDVAAELHDGEVRTELTLDPSTTPGVPLQHGLPGQVDVVVEETTPARLLLRSMGRLGG